MVATQAVEERPPVAAQAEPAQKRWAAKSVAERLRVLRQVRFELVRRRLDFIAAISADLARTEADTLSAEVLPLLAACRFLERNAASLLRPRKMGQRGLPFWLAGVDSTVERLPFGSILIIGAANYPLFLAGVQALQALAAGNAVVWKPGQGGQGVALVFAQACTAAGLPPGLLRITDESVATAQREIATADKIVFTGSGRSGRAVLCAAAARATPVVAELSGCDAVVVLPSADPARVVDALTFGMRLNGSSTCMAPRRLILVGNAHDDLLAKLETRFAATPGIRLSAASQHSLQALVEDAQQVGATVQGEAYADLIRPILIRNGTAAMLCAQEDIFAPVLTVLSVDHVEDIAAFDAACPFGLSFAIFGDEAQARALGVQIDCGTVLINDLIVPTADPRIPFGGRRASGFGVTRGAEGLLEMTAIKVVQARRGNDKRPYEPTGADHLSLFEGVIAMSYAGSWRERFAGLKTMITAAKKLKEKQ